jgi:hypothetical protein
MIKYFLITVIFLSFVALKRLLLTIHHRNRLRHM